MLRWLVGLALVLATLGGDEAALRAPGDAGWPEASRDIAPAWARAPVERTARAPSPRHQELPLLGERPETERELELDDDPDPLARVGIVIALATWFEVERPTSDAVDTPHGATHLATVRTSRGPPRA